eukprot:12900350-Alexandrium_andersonii.AAC.1
MSSTKSVGVEQHRPWGGALRDAFPLVPVQVTASSSSNGGELLLPICKEEECVRGDDEGITGERE